MTGDGDKSLIIGLPSGIRAEILPFGASLRGIFVPGRDGTVHNILISPAKPEDHRRHRNYRGATVGRFANRIGGARFELDGESFDLSANEPPNLLHGGVDGFDRRDWNVASHWMNAATLKLESPDGDQGFPGTMSVLAEFALEPPATLVITYRATVTRPCPVSITSHGYFNLAGGGSVADHMLQIPAEQYLPVDEALIPEGPPRAVAGTHFDFRSPRPVLRPGEPGFDHCFCLAPSTEVRRVATLYDPGSGREMRVESNQPGLQVFAPLQPNPEIPDHNAICLEPEAWPDAPNRPDFPSAILRPGETYEHKMRLVFSTRDN
ncbi:aldose epimerase family protein [Thioclava atlantica]|uniref:Aldose 1-epimerase n=1 Tax=Thioclava atlantica TaxID=1317124 RepID=A0A085TT79_9RHOB|nr:aldose epimerase family protein [Thioclava atlantica]KFE33926.1 aldose 1-epimerase [Thioclava atlantica]